MGAAFVFGVSDTGSAGPIDGRSRLGRAADDVIKAMRRKGELADAHRPKKESAGRTLCTLADLIEKRVRQKAQDWSRLNALTTRELDEIVAKANACLFDLRRSLYLFADLETSLQIGKSNRSEN